MSEPKAKTQAPERKIYRVENHTAQMIRLPATESFPAGLTLKPGMNTPDAAVPNTVPGTYFRELFDQKKQRGTKVHYPGRYAVECLTKRVRYSTPDGWRFGPRITIYEDAQMHRPDGVIPDTLDSYGDKPALVIIEAINDIEAMERYTFSRSEPVASAARAKLARLRNEGGRKALENAEAE